MDIDSSLALCDAMPSQMHAQKHRSHKTYPETERIAELTEVIQRANRRRAKAYDKAIKPGVRFHHPDRALIEVWSIPHSGHECCQESQNERVTAESPSILTVRSPIIIMRYHPDPMGRRCCIEDVTSKMHRRLVLSVILLYLCIQIDAQDNADQSPASAPILSLTMATLSLSFPVVRKDSRSSAVLLFATYLGSLFATTAYGYVCFPNVGDCQLAVLLTVTLSTFGTLLVFSTSQEGTEAALTFLPLILSLSAFFVGNFPAIKNYAMGLLRSIWRVLQVARDSFWNYSVIKIRLWTEAMGTYLTRVSRRMQNSPSPSRIDLEAGGVQPCPCTTRVT
jgi:hypothetical protein